MKYKFHVGDYVETKDGRVGYITHIIEATKLEPPYIRWVTNNGGPFIYPIYSWTHCYKIENSFKRIGKYDFTKPEQPKEIEKLADDIEARFELPDGNHLTMKTYQNDNTFVAASYSYELVNKINELVDAVNELREEHE